MMYKERIKKSIYRVMNLILTSLRVTTLRIGNTLIEEVSDLIRFKFHSSTSLRGIEVNQVKIGTDTSDGVTFISPHGGATNGIIVGSTTEVPEIIGLTTTQRNALTAYDGMIIYNTSLTKFQVYQGSAWITSANLAEAQTFANVMSFSEDIKLALTKILYLDTDLDTYLYSNADDNISFYAGAQLVMRLITNNATIYKPLTLAGNLLFDTDNTYLIGSSLKGISGIHIAQSFFLKEITGMLALRNSSDTNYETLKLENLYVGGAARIGIAGNALLLSGNWNYAPRMTNGTTTNRTELNGQSGMFYYDTTLGQMMYYNTAWRTLATFEEDIKLAQTKKIYFDTDLDTYIMAGGDDDLRFYNGNEIYLRLYSNSIYLSKNVLIPETIFVAFDTDQDTRIYASADDILKIKTGNVERVEIKDASTTISNNLLINGALVLDAETALTNSGGTPTVANNNSFLITNAGGQVITNFTNGIEGQLIYLRFADANTTLDDCATIALSSGGDKNFGADDMCVLVLRGTVWLQVGGVI